MDFFSKNDAGSVPKKISFLKIMILYSWKNSGFFSRNDAGSVPKTRFFEFSLGFFPKIDASSVLSFWIFSKIHR